MQQTSQLVLKPEPEKGRQTPLIVNKSSKKDSRKQQICTNMICFDDLV